MYRLIVMNGCRILQKYDQEWKTTGLIKRVEGDIKPGIYNLFLSESVQKNQSYRGLLLFVDKKENIIYQKTGQGYVKHDARFFGKKPPIGKIVTIQYRGGAEAQVINN
ncbi:MAG: conjugal transfer protein TraO [Burkholderiales bacterium]|nr:conjugal transfer protein TraO [Nitrosomonas sp.]MCP5276711.1 conjugal transfer protein TraO [Burkholderiales bacterium]MCP5303617.1 conjugal transfer protein TraO [Pseudomonadales bacterium]